VTTPATRVAPPASRAPWHDDWIVRVEWAAPRDRVVTTSGLQGSGARRHDASHVLAVVAGTLTNAHELAPAAPYDPAALVARLYEADGERTWTRLRGPFAAIVWDRVHERVHVVHDQIGIQPLFHARSGSAWLFSSSADALAAQHGVSRAIDAVVLSEWLCGWFPAPEDTAYEAVKRLPPATILTITPEGHHSRRYWDPTPGDAPNAWLSDAEVERFDGLFERAVARTTESARQPAIFLSGGIDSISVAGAATDAVDATARPRPLALSLAFPDAASNESEIQIAVADRLGLPLTLVPLEEAAGPTGLVDAALSLTADWPQPMWNVWAPAYMDLARRAAQQGADTILTGRGGDEWLTVTPYLLADLVARGDIAGVWRLLAARRRSNGLRGVRSTLQLLWTMAGRPLGSAALDAVAHGPWHRRRRRRLLSERPEWIAPDPAVRLAMDARTEQWIDEARPRHGFYMRESRLALFHPAVAHDMEETQELGRRHGLRVLHPFWDVDLIEMLYRVPPQTLMRDGRAKWLLRRRLAARLPGLGLERRGKVSARGVFAGIVAREARTAWERLGGLHTLTQLGVVSSTGVKCVGASVPQLDVLGGPGRTWSLLTLEMWARRRAEPGSGSI
jgi:asparagine synthase (glutamine-hydrolysing)